MIVVIADDITGAAELAGIAFAHGFKTLLRMELEGRIPCCDVLVINSDSRSMTENGAVAVTTRLMNALGKMGDGMTVFKKTDSALRGHIMAELSAMLASPYAHFSKVLFLPANPSRDRIIRNGVYLIHGKPIHLTDFSYDPEFPARSSLMSERFPEAVALGVMMPDAVCLDDVRQLVRCVSDDTLLAGAADLFSAFLENRKSKSASPLSRRRIDLSDALVVAGSTQSGKTQWDMPAVSMPLGVYEGREDAGDWLNRACSAYNDHHALLLDIPFQHLTGRDVALRLREVMAEVVSRLLAVRLPSDLVIEGGATASAILNKMGWEDMAVADVFSPGVIRLSVPGGCLLTLKPGSYSWGDLFRGVDPS